MKRSLLLPLGLLAAAMANAQQPPSDPHTSQTASPPPAIAVPVPVVPPRPNGNIQNSVVRITSTEVEPDYRAPWNSGGIGRGVGAGFIVSGNRIMTNAHVVSNSRYL